jgi:hypothetical protein
VTLSLPSAFAFFYPVVQKLTETKGRKRSEEREEKALERERRKETI